MKKPARSKFRGAGEVAFSPRWEKIRKMLDEKYPKIVIYETYQDELNISYSQFIRYVSRYLEDEHHGKKQGDTAPHDRAVKADDKPAITKKEAETKATGGKNSKDFRDDATDRAKDDDLF